MSVIETFAAPAQFPAHIRFVVVNNRVPRADALCALCGTKIRQTYVHELQTPLSTAAHSAMRATKR
jgi:hypothetical protein